MKYYIIAGEASGDLHGSNLMKGIYAQDPEAQIRFWGGDLMSMVWTGVQNHATPLAAGGGAHSSGMGGVVLDSRTCRTMPELFYDPVFNHHICILDALHMIHLRAFQLQCPLRQNSRQSTYIIYYSLHKIMTSCIKQI